MHICTSYKPTSLYLPIGFLTWMLHSLRKSSLGESGSSSGTTPSSLTFIICVQTASNLR